MGNTVTKFNYDWLRTDKALGLFENLITRRRRRRRTFVALWGPFPCLLPVLYLLGGWSLIKFKSCCWIDSIWRMHQYVSIMTYFFVRQKISVLKRSMSNPQYWKCSNCIAWLRVEIIIFTKSGIRQISGYQKHFWHGIWMWLPTKFNMAAAINL